MNTISTDIVATYKRNSRGRAGLCINKYVCMAGFGVGWCERPLAALGRALGWVGLGLGSVVLGCAAQGCVGATFGAFGRAGLVCGLGWVCIYM